MRRSSGCGAPMLMAMAQRHQILRGLRLLLPTAMGLMVFASVQSPAGAAQLAPSGLEALRTIQANAMSLERSISSLLGTETTVVATVSSNRWTILRNQPVGLAIGNARYGTEFEPSRVSRVGYTVGWVHGSFNGCAWTATRNLKGDLAPVRDDCAHFDPPIHSFIGLINCIMCSGGTAVHISAATTEYANYRPGKWPLDPVHHARAGHCVEWRWVSKDKQMVMVKDRAWSNNLASWVFVSRSALPEPLPRGHQTSCWRKR